ncbi:MAG: MBL fold metallo-hydrolase [Dermatophilaceae bacterium]
MRLTHYGHACLLVEVGQWRVLIDPGNYSDGFLELRDLDAIVVTHQHADHVDPERFDALVAANRQAQVFSDAQTAEILAEDGLQVEVLVAERDVTVGEITLTPFGDQHAFNHSGVPRVANLGVRLRADGEPTLFHPGDAYDAEPGAVDVLAVPLNAPWTPVRDTIDFVRRIAPRAVVPIHDALLSPIGRKLYLTHVGTHGGEGLTLHDLAGQGPVDIH